MGQIRLDLNNTVFQDHLFSLAKNDQVAVLGTLRKLAVMTWEQVCHDPGLRWELIRSRQGPHGDRMYSFRISKGFRALACREGDWMRILSLHPDHDSAYKKGS
jgi:hypothetical protein